MIFIIAMKRETSILSGQESEMYIRDLFVVRTLKRVNEKKPEFASYHILSAENKRRRV